MKKTAGAEIVELNIMQILLALLRKCWIIVLSAAICGGAVYYVSANWITPRYESTVVFYVDNKSFAADNRLSSSDLYASENLIDTYVVILNSGTTMDEILDHAGTNLTREDVQDMLTVRIIRETVLFQVTVNGTDPSVVGKISGSVAQVLPARINSVISGAGIRVADEGIEPTSPATPNVKRNLVSAVLFGCVFGASLIVLHMMFDTLIRKESDVPVDWNVQVLASVPEDNKRKNSAAHKKRAAQIAVSPRQDEAYKFLRAKLTAMFDGQCYVMGVTSVMAGEGKSTTAVNLARVLAQEGYRVLLMDCDLRRPTVHKKLALAGRPGITEILAGQFAADELLKTVRTEEKVFHVLTSGLLPPNPAELLNSRKMQLLIQSLRKSYDFVIMDLPPVGEVTDALAAVMNIDAYMMVVRRSRCERGRLHAAIEGIQSVNGRVLGILLNCAKK